MMRGIYWLPTMEDMITAWEHDCIALALFHGYNVIVDATNLNPKSVEAIKNLGNVKNGNVEIEFKVFDTPLDVCIQRDLIREDGVGEKVIRGMSERYNFPPKKVFVPMKQNENLQRAIICDLDGCLALHNGRGPFEYEKCDTDLPNFPVLNILDSYSPDGDVKIIFVSGREDSCKDKTVLWLENLQRECDGHGAFDLGEYELHMRKTGDYRKDTVIKQEIFDTYIKDKYKVDFCIDDRSCVVDLWRSMGLTCLQVAESFD